ncbi:MAG: hypothetical protein AB7P20_09950 [Rhizobiaceae bacterium]
MDWKDDTEGQVLKRIAMLLIALAALADRSCDRSLLVRRLVLWFLRRGENVARDFVTEEAEARGLAMPYLPEMSAGDSVADAMLLAAVFRALALILQCLPTRSPDDRQWWASRDRSPGRQVYTILGKLRSAFATRPPAYDTS